MRFYYYFFSLKYKSLCSRYGFSLAHAAHSKLYHISRVERKKIVCLQKGDKRNSNIISVRLWAPTALKFADSSTSTFRLTTTFCQIFAGEYVRNRQFPNPIQCSWLEPKTLPGSRYVVLRCCGGGGCVCVGCFRYI